MRGMNCERAAALLPLYAAGDLDGASGEDVEAHVAACVDCRKVAGEFRESRALLVEAFETPEFGAEFYAGIRSSVLEKISRDREPSTPSFVAALFGRRLIYAASLALLLLACGLTLRHFRRDANESPREMAKEQREQPARSQPRQADAPSPSPRIEKRQNAPQVVLANSRPPKRQRPFIEGSPIRVGLASINRTQIASLPGSPSAVEATNTVSQPAPEFSRIEIQTADPSIRIIWLAPRESEAPSPLEPKNENGDRK